MSDLGIHNSYTRYLHYSQVSLEMLSTKDNSSFSVKKPYQRNESTLQNSYRMNPTIFSAMENSTQMERQIIPYSFNLSTMKIVHDDQRVYNQQELSQTSVFVQQLKEDKVESGMSYREKEESTCSGDTEFPREIEKSNPQKSTVTSTKLSWNSNEDEILMKVAVQYKNDWKKIARRLTSLTKKRCTPHFLKTRYNEMTSNISRNRVKFTHKEDLIIAKYYIECNGDWQKIATHLRTRTAIMLKNRFYSYIRKKDKLEALLKEIDQNERNGVDLEMIQEDEEKEVFMMNPQEKKPSLINFSDINATFIEMNYLSPEEELHERITPFNIDTSQISARQNGNCGSVSYFLSPNFH